MPKFEIWEHILKSEMQKNGVVENGSRRAFLKQASSSSTTTSTSSPLEHVLSRVTGSSDVVDRSRLRMIRCL